MAETQIEGSEALTVEQPLYRLASSNPTKIHKALDFFQTEGMRGPAAAERLLSLFKAFPQEDPSHATGLIDPGVSESKTLWDQVGWAYRHPNQLTQAQKDSLIPLQYYALDALAHPATAGISGSEKRVLSRVKGSAGTLLQEYDTYIAGILDPDLSEWKLPVGKITTKTATALAAVAFALSACGPVTPSSTVDIRATLTAAATEPYTPTATQTEIVKTPTVTLTPSETKVPMPDYYKGLPQGTESAVFVTDEQLKQIKAEAAASDLLSEPYPDRHGYAIEPYKTSAEEGMNLTCFYGESCTVFTLVQKKNPFGGDNIFVVIWVFRDPDGAKRVVEHDLIDPAKGYNTFAAKEYLKRLNTIKKTGQILTLGITTLLLNVSQDEVDPYYWSTTNGAGEKAKDMYSKLNEGPAVFPEGIEEIPLNPSVYIW